MTDLIIARFDTQFAGMAIYERMLARGVRRDQIALSIDESVGNSPASSSAPTTVISRISHLGMRDERNAAGKSLRASRIRSPSNLPNPKAFGHAVVTIELSGILSADQVEHLLGEAGACSIARENGALSAENPNMWPEIGHASNVDVQRAIAAVRGGEAKAL